MMVEEVGNASGKKLQNAKVRPALTPKEDIQQLFTYFTPIMAKISLEYEQILHSDYSWHNATFFYRIGEPFHKGKSVPTDELITKIARQASFFLLNKIFSYEVLRQVIAMNYGLSIPNLYNPDDERSVHLQLQHNFAEIIRTYEVAPLFKDNFTYSVLPFTPNLDQLLLNFISFLGILDFNQLTEDFLAEFYQFLLPNEHRKEFGQIYTPTKIAELMAHLCIKDPCQRVLDPACGCGILLQKSYKRLKSLHHPGNGVHAKLLDQLWGIEINEFPSHLAMMGLAFQDVSAITENAGILIGDFLKMGPLEKYMVKSKNLRTGETSFREMPSQFDVIIGNPPYIKQEDIPDKKAMMKRLPEFATYRSKTSKTDRIPQIKLGLTGKTDYYGFFVWYSTYFLKDGGRLGFIIPNKWLDVKYGEKLKEFLMTHYAIRAIIGFRKNVFDDAQVSTIILIADRESDRKKREQNITTFLMLNTIAAGEDLDGLVYGAVDPKILQTLDQDSYCFDNREINADRTLVFQRNLLPTEKWSIKYLFQSQFLQRFQHSPSIKLHNNSITKVVGGIKTGANDFFYPNVKTIAKFTIEHQFLRPGIKSGRNIPDSFTVSMAPDKFLAIPPNLNLSLFPGLRSYIDYCDSTFKYQDRPSVNWKPWFSIPPQNQDCPDILFLRHINRDFRARLNTSQAIVADGVRGIHALDPNHIMFYFGICNSTFFYWQAHILGRWEGQGDLQLLVYELKQFRVPDISQLSPDKTWRVETIARSMLQFGKTDMLLQDLDLAVLDCFNLEDDYDLLIKETHQLEHLRISKKF